MKIPRKNRSWVKEIDIALIKAEKRAGKEGIDIAYLYKYAPEIVIRKRGIKDKDKINQIQTGIEDRVQEDWSIDIESKKYHIFHFVSSYIFSHVEAEIFDEFEGDRIMLYVSENMLLFYD